MPSGVPGARSQTSSAGRRAQPGLLAQPRAEVRGGPESAVPGDDVEPFLAAFDEPTGQVPARTVRERTVVLPQGSVFTVPRGTEHKPYAPARAAILVLEPTGTLSAGDRHDEIPDHVDATTGHAPA